MNKTFLLVVAAAFLVAPLAMAHTPAGTPDRFCTGPTKTHDYGAPATGRLIWNYQDGNLQECGTTQEFQIAQICVDDAIPESCIPVCENGPVSNELQTLCDSDRTADWDRDLEYAVGGGVFAAVEPASVDCWDIPAHHGSSTGITVWAEDVVFLGDVTVSVTSDWARADDPTQPECGDNVTEVCDPTDPAEVPGVTCNPLDQAVRGIPPATGLVAGFGPGQDGVYNIFVGPGTAGSSQGHIWSN